MSSTGKICNVEVCGTFQADGKCEYSDHRSIAQCRLFCVLSGSSIIVPTAGSWNVRATLQLTPCTKFVLEKSFVSQIVKKLQPFVESQGSLPCSHQPSTGRNLNPLKTEFLLNTIKDSACTSQETHYISATKLQNAVWGNSRCLLWKPYGTHRYTLWEKCRILVC
jgi:hypothetical protein